MTDTEYVDGYIDYVVDCYETNNEVDYSDGRKLRESIEDYASEHGLPSDYCNNKSDCDNYTAIELIKEHKCFDWSDSELSVTNLQQVIYYCVESQLCNYGYDNIYDRCVEKILTESV